MKAITPWARLLQDARSRAGLSQRELAKRAHSAQSVVARIEGGQVSPSVDTLSRILAAAGFTFRTDLFPIAASDPVVDAYKRDIDRSLLVQNLKRSPDERIKALAALSGFAKEARRAGRAAAR